MALLAPNTNQQMFVPTPENMNGMGPMAATGYMSPMFQRSTKALNPLFSRFKKAGNFDYDLF